MKKFLSLLAILGILVACHKEKPQENNENQGNNETPVTVVPATSITEGAENISAINVSLKGKVNPGSAKIADLKQGFQYSVSADMPQSSSVTKEVADVDGSNGFSAVITGLEPDTKYYYRAFVRQNGKDSYGETKEFTTKDLGSMLETKDATNVETANAVINAKLDLTDVAYAEMEYGFCCGLSDTSLDIEIKATGLKDNAFASSLTGLTPKTQYWFKAYVKLDGKAFYGEPKALTTDIVHVQSVSLSKPDYKFTEIGGTVCLIPTVLPADANDKSVTWSSSDDGVAKVDANGIVTATGNGTATITVTTKDQGKTATCAISVAQVVTSVTFDFTELTLKEGAEQTLTVTVLPSNAANKTISLVSSDSSIATIDGNGKVTAVAKGKTAVYAVAQDGSNAFAKCDVTVLKPVTSVTFENYLVPVFIGKSVTLTPTVLPTDASDTGIRWLSEDSSVATVSSTGVVTGVALGETTVYALANDNFGAFAKLTVQVRQPVTGITLSKTSLDFTVGQHDYISATVTPSNAYWNSYTMTSSDPSVASIDNYGRVDALKKGKATITFTARDGSGVTASCDVLVSNTCPAGAVDFGFRNSEGFRLYWATCNIGESGFVSSPEQYGDYYAWGETTTYYSSLDPLTWKSGKSAGYTWASYKFASSADGPFSKYVLDSKYGTVDNKKVLELTDDVAYKKLGGNWRIPTDEEWTQLRTGCTWTWTTQNGVKGRKVSDTNGHSIFLPASGYMDTELSNQGSFGYYWSSTLSGTRTAFELEFSQSMVRRFEIKRPAGQSVRPVCD